MACSHTSSFKTIPSELKTMILTNSSLVDVVRLGGVDREFRFIAENELKTAGLSSIDEMIRVENIMERMLPFLRAAGYCPSCVTTYKEMPLESLKNSMKVLKKSLSLEDKPSLYEVFKRVIADQTSSQGPLFREQVPRFVLEDRAFLTRVFALKQSELEHRTDLLAPFEKLIQDLWDGARSLESVTNTQKDDPVLVLTACQPGDNQEDLQFASDRLKDHKPLVLEVVRKHGWPLEHASIRLKADPQVVLAAVEKAGGALEFASAELRARKEIVLAAVKENHEAIEFASLELLLDPEIQMAAQTQW